MIYFIQMDIPNGLGPIKIGYSSNPTERIKEFTLPWPVKILGFVGGSVLNEKWMHRRLAPHRMMREWFEPTPEVMSLIEQVSLTSWAWPDPRETLLKSFKPKLLMPGEVSTLILPYNIPSARQLRAIRAWLGLNQFEFGQKVGVSLATINNYEGEIVKPSTDSKIAIGRYIAEIGITFGPNGDLKLDQ